MMWKNDWKALKIIELKGWTKYLYQMISAKVKLWNTNIISLINENLVSSHYRLKVTKVLKFLWVIFIYLSQEFLGLTIFINDENLIRVYLHSGICTFYPHEWYRNKEVVQRCFLLKYSPRNIVGISLEMSVVKSCFRRFEKQTDFFIFVRCFLKMKMLSLSDASIVFDREHLL